MNYAVSPAMVGIAAMVIMASTALARRRLPARRLWVLLAIWAAIIALAWAVASAGSRLGII